MEEMWNFPSSFDIITTDFTAAIKRIIYRLFFKVKYLVHKVKRVLWYNFVLQMNLMHLLVGRKSIICLGTWGTLMSVDEYFQLEV